MFFVSNWKGIPTHQIIESHMQKVTWIQISFIQNPKPKTHNRYMFCPMSSSNYVNWT